jgi:hypothetical protein
VKLEGVEESRNAKRQDSLVVLPKRIIQTLLGEFI